MAKKRERLASPHGRLLTELMASRKLTNRAAAEIAGVSPTSIQDWKTGVAPTDFAGIARLADFLGVSLRYLLTGEHESVAGEREVNLGEILAEDGEIISGICNIRITRLVPIRAKRASSASNT